MFHVLKEEGVYGFVSSQKKDCINHVSVRGTSLQSLCEKAQGETIGGRGKLTEEKIKTITTYYGFAVRSHTRDMPEMKAVQATLRHMASIDDAPNHSFCPDVSEVQCRQWGGAHCTQRCFAEIC